MEPAPGEGAVGHVGRNENWALTASDGRPLFVKRLVGSPRETAERFRRVTGFAEFAAAAPPRLWRAPALLGADAEARVLVFEHLPDAESATEWIDDLDVAFARRIGRAIGELHAMPAAAVPVGAQGRSGGLAQRLSALTLEQYAECSGAELEAWALLQHDKALRRALAALGERTLAAPQLPGHCDLRLDQILRLGDGIHLVDWEEFRPADPAFDVGSLVGEWLYQAASAMFADAGNERGDSAEAHDELVRRGARELDVVRPLVMAFWTGYRQECAPDAGLAERATAYAGWHLFDRMLAKAKFSALLGAQDRGIAGIGRTALIDAPRFVATIGLEDS
jgi:predicted trehalose synthase